MVRGGQRCLAVVLMASVPWSLQLAVSAHVGDIVASGFGLSRTPAIAADPLMNSSANSCWTSWAEYWSYKQVIATPQTHDLSTIVSTKTGYVSGYAGTTETDIGTSKGLSIKDNGGFTINTKTIDSTWTSRYTFSSRSGSSYTITNSFTSYISVSYNGTTVQRPTCQLSNVVSQCQSQWEVYVSSELLPSPTPPSHCDINQGIVPVMTWEKQPACASTYQASLSSWRSRLSSITKPPCTQASIGGSLCDTIKDVYVHQQNSVFFPNVSFAPYFSNGYLGSFANITAQNYTKSWWWPTSSTLGVPGCTLGCGRCAVTGGTIQLLYWPEATMNATAAGGAGAVTVSTLGTVLTSPTYYISYKSVFASDGCSGIGPTLYDTIVPIPAAHQLSSVYAGTLPCVAHVQNQFTQEWIATASFNVTDMNQPVPFSIYSSQPWCATYQFEHGCNKECPTSEAYKPIIVVPDVVLQSMDPAWASCYGDIRGAYDPPIALQKASSIIVPQTTVPTPTWSETGTAVPEHSPSQPAAQTNTAIMLPPDPSSSWASAGTLQASQSPCHGYEPGSGPCPWLQDIPSRDETIRASRSSHDVGGIVASIFDSVAQSLKLISSLPKGMSQSVTQGVDSSMAVMASEEVTGPITLQFPGESQDATTSQADYPAGDSGNTGAVIISLPDASTTTLASGSSIIQANASQSGTRGAQSADSSALGSDANTASTSTATMSTPYGPRGMWILGAAVVAYNLIAL
ncbi:hypothetical protein MBLNU13_g07079t3 [Cladosporium sp. NU13]